MNGSEVKWLKEMFQQHNRDQQLYLDSKFGALEAKMDKREESCKDCRDCIHGKIDSVELEVEDLDEVVLILENDLRSRIVKSVAVGSAGAVFLSLVLWTAFGTNALTVVGGWLKLLLF